MYNTITNTKIINKTSKSQQTIKTETTKTGENK